MCRIASPTNEEFMCFRALSDQYERGVSLSYFGEVHAKASLKNARSRSDEKHDKVRVLAFSLLSWHSGPLPEAYFNGTDVKVRRVNRA